MGTIVWVLYIVSRTIWALLYVMLHFKVKLSQDLHNTTEERYRSGHNGADSKSDGRHKSARGFESHPLRSSKYSVGTFPPTESKSPPLFVSIRYNSVIEKIYDD